MWLPARADRQADVQGIAKASVRGQSLCLVIADLGPGGAQRVLTTLANAWAGQGRTVTIVTYEKPGAESFYPLSPEIDVRRLDAMADAASSVQGVLANVGRIRTVRRSIQRICPDLVISFVDVMNVIVLLATVGMRVPVIVCERTDPSRAPLPTVWHAARRCSYRRARAVLVQTAAIADLFRPWIGDRVAVIPNAVQVTSERHAGTESSVTRSRSIVAVGRLSEEKRFDLLLQAFHSVASRFPDWTLTVYGEGPLRGALEAQRDALQLTDKVSFPGLTTQIADIYGHADIFVLSSRFEGFPNALCEAMAFGVPVVATDCSSAIPEIVTQGRDGFIVPSGEVEPMARALGDLMADDEMRTRLGENAKSIRQRYSLEAVLTMWDDVFARGGATAV